MVKKKNRDLLFQYFLLIIASFLGVNASQVMQQLEPQKTISTFIFFIMAGIAYLTIYFAVYIFPEELKKWSRKLTKKKKR